MSWLKSGKCVIAFQTKVNPKCQNTGIQFSFFWNLQSCHSQSGQFGNASFVILLVFGLLQHKESNTTNKINKGFFSKTECQSLEDLSSIT